MMQDLIRIGSYVWPYRRLFVLSVVCALIVSAFWALNLSIAFPVVKVLFQNDSLHAYVDNEILSLEKSISEDTSALEKVSPDEVKTRAKIQYRVGQQSRNLLMLTRVRSSLLPYVPRDKFDTMAVILGVLLAATFLKGLFIYFQEMLVGSVVQLTVNAIRQDCFRAALRLDFQSLNRIGTSALMSRMTNDIEQMTMAIRVFGVTLVREPLKAGACTALAFYVNWRLTLVAITVVPLLGLVFNLFGKRLRRASHRTMESMARIYECISETFGSARVVIAFSGFRKHRKQFLKANRDYYTGSMKIVRLGALVRPITEIMGVLSVFAALAPGAYLVLRNTDSILGIKLAAEPMGIAELATLYALLAGTLDPVRKLSGIFEQIKRGMAGSERVFDLIDEKSIVPEPKSPRMMIRHSTMISLKDVSFRYEGLEAGENQRPLALKGVSLDVPFGEVVAVVGGNGSGKSTLLSLLPRFMDPSEGRVLIDGVDIRELRTHDLRSQIGLVTQETLLFNDSIFENIRYGSPAATREMVLDAASQAQAAGFIKQLPDGFETIVGDKGGKLSGGQRQRIALARAILRDPAILVLDEATSAVDSQSEEVIHCVLKKFSKNRTVFIISHVLNRTFLDLVTRIVVMDQGRIVATGSHEELMASCATYQALNQSQLQIREAA
jgi:subfamily B ATP-binding cassette protein MsbA